MLLASIVLVWTNATHASTHKENHERCEPSVFQTHCCFQLCTCSIFIEILFLEPQKILGVHFEPEIRDTELEIGK